MGKAVLKQKPKVLWLGCSTEDPLYGGVKAMEDLLTQKNVTHVWNPSGGGHSWTNWQVYLAKYTPLLFRDSDPIHQPSLMPSPSEGLYVSFTRDFDSARDTFGSVAAVRALMQCSDNPKSLPGRLDSMTAVDDSV